MATKQPTRGSNLDAARKGTTVHRVIREQLSAYFAPRYGPRVSVQIPGGSFEPYRDKSGLKIGGGPRQGQGDFDLAFRSMAGSVMLVAEVKPDNLEGRLGGQQLEHYINHANRDEDLKKKHGVRVFSPMLPDRFDLLPTIYAEGRAYAIRWDGPGLLLYREIPRDKDKEKEKRKDKQKETPQSYKDQVKEQRRTSERGTSAPRQIEILRAAPRAPTLPDWTPAQLRRDISAGTLADGLYRDRYSAAWPSGHTTNVVVWVKTSALGREVQFYQEFPEEASFYENFARQNGLSARQGDLIRRTMTDYNRDLWSLLRPDPTTGLASSRSPEYARAELRAIYGEILRRTFEASAAIVGVGAGITSLGNAVRQRGTARTGVPSGRKTADPAELPAEVPAELPLPDWILKSVQTGGDLFRKLEKLMRAPVP